MSLNSLNAGLKICRKPKSTSSPTTESESRSPPPITIQPVRVPPTVFDPQWDHRYPRLRPEIIYKEFDQLNPPVQSEIVKQLEELKAKQYCGIYVPDGPLTNPFYFTVLSYILHSSSSP